MSFVRLCGLTNNRFIWSSDFGIEFLCIHAQTNEWMYELYVYASSFIANFVFRFLGDDRRGDNALSIHNIGPYL